MSLYIHMVYMNICTVYIYTHTYRGGSVPCRATFVRGVPNQNVPGRAAQVCQIQTCHAVLPQNVPSRHMPCRAKLRRARKTCDVPSRIVLCHTVPCHDSVCQHACAVPRHSCLICIHIYVYIYIYDGTDAHVHLLQHRKPCVQQVGKMR